MDAIKELIKLQKERNITIKPADKGAGIVILDFEDYDKSAKEHLYSKDESTEKKHFYKKVHPIVMQEAQPKIDRCVKEAFDNEIISKCEYEAMMTGDKSAGKFYCTFKVPQNLPFYKVWCDCKAILGGEIPPLQVDGGERSDPPSSIKIMVANSPSRPYLNHHT